MGGGRVEGPPPRARGGVDGKEAVLPSWRVFSEEDPLSERAYGQMALGAVRAAGRRVKRWREEG